MYIVDSYALAVVFCIITMLGWGSWANTLKIVIGQEWPVPFVLLGLFYWFDSYVAHLRTHNGQFWRRG
jgi:glucose uptake protein